MRQNGACGKNWAKVSRTTIYTDAELENHGKNTEADFLFFLYLHNKKSFWFTFFFFWKYIYLVYGVKKYIF